jgi:hypothetical protein
MLSQSYVGTNHRARDVSKFPTQTFAASRVNQGRQIASCLPSDEVDVSAELAKEGIPLPFGSRFWASNWPTGKSPLPGLIVHLIPSVSLHSVHALEL